MQGQALSTLTNAADILTTGREQPLLPQLLHAINHASEIEIAVSFVQRSGIALVFDALHEALERGASLKLLTSDYLHITDPKALEQLLSLPEADLRVYQCTSDDGFHTKAYIFVRGETQEGCAFVGSNNLSRQALTNAHEWALRFDLVNGSEYHRRQFDSIRDAFHRIFEHENVTPLTLDWVKHYQSIRRQPQLAGLTSMHILPKPEHPFWMNVNTSTD